MVVNRLSNIKNAIKSNKNIFLNIVGAYGVRGAAIILSLFSLPAYMRYFTNGDILGVWYTIVSIINWVFMFDFGIGHGLRNRLVVSLAEKDTQKSREYISSAYFCVGVIIVIFSIIAALAVFFINWNSFLNISTEAISNRTLQKVAMIVSIGIILQFELKLINSILYALQKSALNNFLNLVSNIIILVYLLVGKSYSDEKNIVILAWVNIVATNLPLAVATIIVFCKSLSKMVPSIRYVTKQRAKEVMNIGIVLLWMQLIFMVVGSMHAFLISNMINPGAVVEYQIYYKIFNTLASLAIIALTPIWSAVTKALVENKYDWIKKTYRVLLRLSAVFFVCCLITLPILQFGINLWLQDKTINVTIPKSICMISYCSIFVLHNVNTSISNGMSWFKPQMTWMTVAAISMIPLAFLFCGFTNDWTGIIWASTISLLPYNILQPILFLKHIKKLQGITS